MNIVKLTDLVSNGSKIRKTVDPKVVLQKGDYPEGTILDANSIIALIQQYAGGSTGTVGSDNGHEYVDLGLPSGTLWATMNVGASSETDYGNCYQYGKGAAQYAATSSDSNYGGTEDPLDSSVDTASQVWGGSWHMPTRAQMKELTDNTTYQWVTNYKGSGINGGTFTATNGAVLFIPAAGRRNDGSQLNVGDNGFCWGSSPNGSDSAYLLRFYDGYKGVYNGSRKYGCSIRPVITLSQ